MIQSLLVGGNDLLNGWWFQLNTNFDSRLLYADSLEGTEKALILSGCFLLFAVRPTRCGKREVLLGVGWLNASTPTRQSLSLILGGMNGDLFCGHNLLCQEIIVACANVTFCGHYLMPGKSIMLAQKVTLRDCFILVVYYLWR